MIKRFCDLCGIEAVKYPTRVYFYKANKKYRFDFLIDKLSHVDEVTKEERYELPDLCAICMKRIMDEGVEFFKSQVKYL